MVAKRQALRYVSVALVAFIITIGYLNSTDRLPSTVHRLLPSATRISSHGIFGGALRDHVHNATLGFGKVFVISLPERTDHRDRLLLAAKLSDVDLHFIEGVHGQSIPAKALPANYTKSLKYSDIGAWRAHINAMREVIAQDLPSAIIMEDDVDWDVRLKPMLHDFAISANGLLESGFQDLAFEDLSSMPQPQHSPYGDGWDVLWLGHCGMHLPSRSGIVLRENDDTVPEARYLHSFLQNERTPLARYPEHTRAVFRDVDEGTCSLAYAVTQSAARNILADLGIDRLVEPFDLALRGWCQGSQTGQRRVCLGGLPQLFDHYRRAGFTEADSDIDAGNHTYRKVSYTNNIRWSVSLNMKKLLDGDTDYDEQYPDS